MKQFLKFTIASFLGMVLFSIFVISFLFLVIIRLSTEIEKKKVIIKPNSVLQISLEKQIRDRGIKSFGFINPLPLEIGSSLGLYDILKSIEHASENDKIKGISLESNFVTAGITQIDEIRNALLKFKESGKFVTSYSDFYSQGSYYIGSVADSIFLNPVGLIDLKGMSTEVNYYKNLGDKYGVRFNVFRAGKFKSAVEPYLNEKMSKESRFQISYLVNGIWDRISANISKARDIDIQSLTNYVDSLNGYFTKKALDDRLIDGLIYEDQYDDKLRAKLGLKNEDEINFVSIEDYISLDKETPFSNDKIAVLYAEGIINYGEVGQYNINHESIAKALKKIRADDEIKAVVLRVNSPGGNAQASELILRQLELTKEKKPIVVSMGDYAASGGYYISCNADYIFAEPNTITGSIGVFTNIPTLEKLAQTQGVSSEVVSTNKRSFQGSLTHGFNPLFANTIQKSVLDFYQTFLRRVSVGRNLSLEKVDSIAQGRVWLAKDALNIKLIDSIGNLDEALNKAAELAGIGVFETEEYPKLKAPIERLLDLSMDALVDHRLKKEMDSKLYQLYSEIKEMEQNRTIQAKFPIKVNMN